MTSSRLQNSLASVKAARPVRWSYWFAAASAVAMVLSVAQRHDRLLADDAYITFRYARNLASGQGLVYNVGEPVLGTSTPLFALLLAAGARLGLDLPQLAVWIGALAWIGVVLVLARIRRDAPIRSIAPLLAVGASVTFIDNLGMESPLYALLCLSSLLLAGSGYTLPAAALAGLASITRLDGGLVAAVLLLWSAARTRRLPWRETLLVLLFVLPWYAYAWAAYGSPLPQSLQAKAGLAHNLGFGGGDFLRGGVDLLRARLATWSALGALLTAALVGLVGGLRRSALPYTLWGLVYIVAYWATGMPQFGWYYVPLVPWVASLAQDGLCRLSSLPGATGKWVAVLLSLGTVVAAGQMVVHTWRSSAASPPRALAYREVGHWLAENARPEERVALLEIGVTGYYSGIGVVDTMGLVTPYLGARLVDWGQSLTLALQHDWPEYALAVDTTAWEAVERQEWFNLAYRLEAEFDHSKEGDPAARMRLYRRMSTYPPQPQTTLTLESANDSAAVLRDAGLHGLPLLTPGTPLNLSLTWECITATAGEWPVEVVLRDNAGIPHSLLSEPSLLRGGLPTAVWRSGEVVQESLSMVLPLDLPAGPAHLDVIAGGQLLASGDVVVSPTEAEVIPYLAATAKVSFGESIKALGWETAQRIAKPGGVLDLTVIWETDTVPDNDWSVFVHLVDTEERPLAQFDGYPFDGLRPTSTWTPGQVYADTYSLRLPADMPPGQYRLLLGVYDWRTGERLMPFSSEALPSGALVVEKTIVVEPGDD